MASCKESRTFSIRQYLQMSIHYWSCFIEIRLNVEEIKITASIHASFSLPDVLRELIMTKIGNNQINIPRPKINKISIPYRFLS